MMLLLVPAVTLVLVPALVAGGGVYVTQRPGRQWRLLGAAALDTLNNISLGQCQLSCLQRTGCVSFNHFGEFGPCELFGVDICYSSGIYAAPAAGWSWFRVSEDLRTESVQQLWSTDACQQHGRCTDSCLRKLGEGCRHSQQCRPPESAVCSDLTCQCDSEHWQYNSTLCVPRGKRVYTDGRSWLWQRIVPTLCAAEFEVSTDAEARLTVSEQYSLKANRYLFTMSTSQVEAWRYTATSSSRVYLSYVNLLSTTTAYRYSVSWCSGQLRLTRNDSTTQHVSWNDGAAFSPSYLAVWSSSTVGSWLLDRQLVDPWFDLDWSPSRSYFLPPDTFLPRRRAEQDFTVQFECRIGVDCQWIALDGFRYDAANRWQIIIGGWLNSKSGIQRAQPFGHYSLVTQVSSPSILSTTELRLFRIHFSPTKISVYRSNETTPFMSHAVASAFTIRFDGPMMCCNDENIEYRLVEYDSGWSHEKGFQWGVDNP